MLGESQPLCGSTDDIPCNSWESVENRTFVPRKGVFLQGACWEMSSSVTTAEKREVHMDYCCACSLVLVYSCICSRPSAFTSRTDSTWLALISRHVPCNKLLFLVQKFHFRLIPKIYRIYHRYSRKKAGLKRTSCSTREGRSSCSTREGRCTVKHHLILCYARRRAVCSFPSSTFCFGIKPIFGVPKTCNRRLTSICVLKKWKKSERGEKEMVKSKGRDTLSWWLSVAGRIKIFRWMEYFWDSARCAA